MQINEFLDYWQPTTEYIDVSALKTRFSALRGLSNLRPDLTVQQCVDFANNVLTVNKAQYEELAKLNPFSTYGETSSGAYTNTTNGTNNKTQTDTRQMQTVQSSENKNSMAYGKKTDVTNATEYGKITDGTETPTGTKQTDVTDYAYNGTSATHPDQTTRESYNGYKTTSKETLSGTDTQTQNETLSGTDTQTQTGTTTTSTGVTGGDLKDVTEYSDTAENTHNDTKKGYVLRDIIEMYPEWVQIYDRIVQDIFSVIGSLIATRKFDSSLEW